MDDIKVAKKSKLPNKSDDILIVNNIEVVYSHVILVLKGVSLKVKKGGITALLGGNGAGKNSSGFQFMARSFGSSGISGAVRLIWGDGTSVREYPTTNTEDV